MKLLSAILVLAFAALALPVFAATKTATLSVPGMSGCPVCPITIKKSLTDAKGVSKVELNVGKNEATVTFDDGKTSANALMKATADAGYPSTLKQ